MGCDCGHIKVKDESTETNNVNPKIKNNTFSLMKARTNVDDLEVDDFINQMLKLHNDERKKYKYDELTKNEDLNDLASEYAKELALRQGKIRYEDYIYEGSILGENIIKSETKEPKKIFDCWLKEGNDYNFNDKKFSHKTAHYTQIIWKDTKEVGIGIWHDNENKKYVTVVLYNPPGNTLGKFNENT